MLENLSEFTPWGALAIGVIAFLLMRRGGRRRKEINRNWSAASASPRPAVHPAAEAAGEAWEVSLHEQGREIAAVLDNKMRLLQMLTQQADESANRLEAVLKEAQARGLTSDTLRTLDSERA